MWELCSTHCLKTYIVNHPIFIISLFAIHCPLKHSMLRTQFSSMSTGVECSTSRQQRASWDPIDLWDGEGDWHEMNALILWHLHFSMSEKSVIICPTPLLWDMKCSRMLCVQEWRPCFSFPWSIIKMVISRKNLNWRNKCVCLLLTEWVWSTVQPHTKIICVILEEPPRL